MSSLFFLCLKILVSFYEWSRKLLDCTQSWMTWMTFFAHTWYGLVKLIPYIWLCIRDFSWLSVGWTSKVTSLYLVMCDLHDFSLAYELVRLHIWTWQVNHGIDSQTCLYLTMHNLCNFLFLSMLRISKIACIGSYMTLACPLNRLARVLVPTWLCM